MNAAIERIYRCVMLAFGRGRIKLIDDSGAVQRAQVRFGPLEIIDNLPVPHDFGFTSNPPADSDAFAAFLGGERKNGMVISVGSQQYRLKNLKSGETAIYDSRGQSVYLTENGIVINGGGLPMKVTNTPSVRMETDLHVTGNILDNCDSNTHTVADMRTIYNGHDHSDPQGSTVGTPNQGM